jgi:hypothetical protein
MEGGCPVSASTAAGMCSYPGRQQISREKKILDLHFAEFSKLPAAGKGYS